MEESAIRQRQEAMVKELKEGNFIKSPLVERAFLTVPRYLFIPGYDLDLVYNIYKAIVTRTNAQGLPTSSCSAPLAMVQMLEMLDLRPGQCVMEIGAATGYNAALIGCIVGQAGKVVTIDIQPDLVESAREHLDAAGFPWVRTVAADGGYGYPEWAPYDRIILTTSSYIIAPAWREQLKDGGRLVLPLDLGGIQSFVSFIRQGDELVSTEILSDVRFMWLQGAFSRPAISHTPVGADPRLVLTSDKGRLEAAEQVARWLAEDQKDYPSGVTVNRQAMYVGLLYWWPVPEVGLNDEEVVGLMAQGDFADREDLPALYGWGGPSKMKFTLLALGKDGCAALVRPPGQTVPFMEWDKFEQDNQPFEITVRQFGQDELAAQKLLKWVRLWDQAGRPNLYHIAIRAVPADKPVTLAEGELLQKRSLTNLVIRYK